MKKVKRSSIILIAVLSFSMILLTCGKKDATMKILDAKVTLVLGQAFILRDDTPEKVKLDIGTRLKPSDVILTGRNGSVNVVIADRGVFKIKNNSRVSFQDLLVVDDENNVARIKVAAGKVVLGLKKLQKDSVFEVQTPTAVAGVRGTSFVVSVQKQESAAFPYFVKVSKKEAVITKIGVLTGSVEIINPKNTSQKVMVNSLKEATLINDDFDKIKIEKITRLTLDEIKEIKELSEIRELKLKEISDEITSVEPEVEEVMKSELKTRSDIKSREEDLRKTEQELENEKIKAQKESIQKIKKIKKDSGKYLDDDATSW
ncbi:MAG: FecR domain-containing protein [Spirochaetes bacterium]|nr:FecR domain-containing protein [Spirochaetota bacterium]